jgi:hypothetical protein
MTCLRTLLCLGCGVRAPPWGVQDGENAFIPPSLSRGEDLIDATLCEALGTLGVTVRDAKHLLPFLHVEWKLFLPHLGPFNEAWMPSSAALEAMKVRVTRAFGIAPEGAVRWERVSVRACVAGELGGVGAF